MQCTITQQGKTLISHTQVMTLVLVVVLTALVGTVILYAPITPMLQALTAAQHYLGIVLWAGEIVLFGYIAHKLTEGPRRVAFAALMLAILIQLLVSTIIALAVVEHDAGLAVARGHLAHLLGMPAGFLLLFLSLRPLLQNAYQAFPAHHKKPRSKKPVEKSEVSFQFDAKRRVPKTTDLIRVPPSQTEKFESVGVKPPASFVPQPPDAHVQGTVMLPREVIYKSVPEAVELFGALPRVNVPTACFIPHLARPSMWMTIGQILKYNQMKLPTSLESLKERWVRIPARHFATQVPQEYYTRQVTPLSWMTLPEVEQEKDFSMRKAFE